MKRVVSDIPKTLLSVIIPAYNVEAYIGESLGSALRQARINEIELIVVDDGSTDSTLDRILAIQGTEQGQNIKVIRQENRGVSAARNAAMAHARSPYIGFLDADDIWSTNFSDVIMPLLDAGAADIIEFNLGIIDSRGRIIDRMELIDRGSVGLRAGARFFRWPGFIGASCGKVSSSLRVAYMKTVLRSPSSTRERAHCTALRTNFIIIGAAQAALRRRRPRIRS